MSTELRDDPRRRYSNLFESPAAAFLELDFSGVGAMVRALRASGVTDLTAHLCAHPELVREMMRTAHVVEANEHAVELFSPGDKQALMGSAEPFWPDASTFVFAEGVVAAVTGQANFLRETVMRNMSGVEFDVDFAVHFDPEVVGGGVVTVGVVDITERNRARVALAHAEFMFRNMFHGMAVPFLRLDSSRLRDMFAQLRKAGVVEIEAYFDAHPRFLRDAMDALIIVEANEAAVKLHRAPDASSLEGPMSRFWSPSRQRLIRDCLSAGYRGLSGFQGEARMLAMDGSEIDILMFIIATPEMREKGIVLVGLIDTTEQVAARQAIESMRADLAHATRVSVLGELTASIAHEINQPLTAIATSSEAGLRWLDRPRPDVVEVRDVLTRIVADVRRASDVVDRVRGMAAHKVTQAAAMSINSVVEEVALFLQHELQAREVTLALELDRSLGVIHADRIQMQQVVLNLSVNAIQAMAAVPVERRRLRISTGPEGDDGLHVCVEDSGPGIDPDKIPRLFESFYSTKEGSMGMGLRICQSIVEAHGGRIDGGNHPEGGARFRVALPLAGHALHTHG